MKRPSLSRAAIVSGAACLAAVGAPAAGAGEPPRDCALATEPYSADTPLLDLLIDPRARALVEKSGLLQNVPPFALGTNPPSFAAIVSPRLVARYFGAADTLVSDLDRQLAALQIRPSDSAARCARYEADAARPRTVPPGRPALLVFDKSSGFRDGPSVEAANAAIVRIGAARGWTVVVTSSAGDFIPETLASFQAVLWNNVSGDVLTLGQRAALRAFVERGGGFAGIHGSGGDPLYLWDWYADELIGARFTGHPDAHQKASVRIENAGEPITRGIAADWAIVEEWYSFATSPRGPGTRVLLTLDEAGYQPVSRGRDLRMGDHPIAWTRSVGKGRSFYSAIGHRPETYSDPNNIRLIEQGLAWAMGLRPAAAGPEARLAGAE